MNNSRRVIITGFRAVAPIGIGGDGFGESLVAAEFSADDIIAFDFSPCARDAVARVGGWGLANRSSLSPEGNPWRRCR